jgi:6-phosphogluconolactonase
MSFRRAARAARSGQFSSNRLIFSKPTLAALVVLLAGLSLSCNNTDHGSPGPVPTHTAYITLPTDGSVGQLTINGSTGAITLGSKTPTTVGSTPTGLALTPSQKFLYTANSRANTVSTFSVASDGTLNLSGSITQTGAGPNAVAIDPTGKYLLVTNSLSDNISVFSIDSGSGALSEVAGSPFFANNSPTSIVFTHSGQFVYVANPGIGMVTGFSFSSGVLTQTPGSPVFSGAGASAVAVDAGDLFLYVTNPSAVNPPPNQAVLGNLSGFSIDPATGNLTLVPGSPFTSNTGSIGPTALTVDPGGRFVYAVSSGTAASIWCFTITSTTGQLTPATNSPFSLAAGGLFVLIDPLGNFLYIGSEEDGVINGYTYNSSTGTPTLIDASPFKTGAPGSMVFLE